MTHGSSSRLVASDGHNDDIAGNARQSQIESSQPIRILSAAKFQITFKSTAILSDFHQHRNLHPDPAARGTDIGNSFVDLIYLISVPSGSLNDRFICGLDIALCFKYSETDL